MSKKYPTNQFLQNAIKNAFDSQTSEPKHLADDEDLLLRWAEQRLSKEEHAELLDHLAQCSNCRLAVSEMVKNGILEFNEQPTKQLQSSVTRSKNTFRYTTLLFLGGLMTSTICLLLCLFFLQGTPNQTDVARIEVTGQQTDPNSKLGGTVRSVSNPADKSNKFALLIGINKYGKLKENEWLDGCRNDIEAVKSVITGRLGFVAENVVVLLDEQATRDEILKQMKQLTTQIQSRSQNDNPAQVLFYFSGHGSRILDQPAEHPDHDSEDGYDSTLVVYDSEHQGSNFDIRDDELNQFSHQICQNNKAELLIVLDSCHSGGGARGITRFRGIDRNLERPLSSKQPNQIIIPKKLPEGAVFISACRSDEKEPEYEINGKKYGLFTYHFTRLLQSEKTVSALDYRSLKDAIRRSYQRNIIPQPPTPTIEGSMRMLAKPVLGNDSSVDYKPYWEAQRNGNSRNVLRIEAGKINNITEHSLYELYANSEQAITSDAESLGWLKITKVEANYSLGQFFQWQNKEHNKQIESVLPNNFKTGVVVERYHDYGDNILSVRIVNAETGKIITPQNHQTIPETIKKLFLGTDLENESSWIRWVGIDENCDIVIKYDDRAKLATLFPATGNIAEHREQITTRGTTIPKSLNGGWGPIQWGTEQGQHDLIQLLRRIMKALSLKRLAAVKSDQEKNNKNDVKKLAVSIFRYDLENDKISEIPDNPTNNLILQGGENDWHQLQIVNKDEKPLYISILCIDPDMQIAPFPFGPENNPYQFDPNIGTDNNKNANRLEPNEKFISNFGFEEPYGTHSIIVLGTREPSNFSHLAQSGLQTKSKGHNASSQIFDFINDQCQIGTRAIKRPPIPRDDAWSIGVLDVVSKPEL